MGVECLLEGGWKRELGDRECTWPEEKEEEDEDEDEEEDGERLGCGGGVPSTDLLLPCEEEEEEEGEMEDGCSTPGRRAIPSVRRLPWLPWLPWLSERLLVGVEEARLSTDRALGWQRCPMWGMKSTAMSTSPRGVCRGGSVVCAGLQEKAASSWFVWISKKVSWGNRESV